MEAAVVAAEWTGEFSKLTKFSRDTVGREVGVFKAVRGKREDTDESESKSDLN